MKNHFDYALGYLMAMADLNACANHQYSFDLTAVEPTDVGIANMLKRAHPAPNWCAHIAFDIMPSKDFHMILRKWFTDAPHMQNMVAHNSDLPDNLATSFIALLQTAVDPHHFDVHRVDIKVSGFYECAWDDLLITSSTYNYLIHLGVSD